MRTETKDKALELLEETRSSFLAECRKVAYAVALNNGSVTIDDVRDRLDLPDGVDGRVFGAVFNSKEWERIGYTQTKRKTSHRRPIAIFKIAEL